MSGWFDTARLGLFIHWGHSSQRGIELSWPMVVVSNSFGPTQTSEISVADYHATAATFNPTKWDAPALAKRAKRAGAQYAVLTTKHHDGFAMFHTKQTDFSIEHTPFKRDIVREYADAMRAEGIRVGFYYSLSDWHHPDYPAFREEDKPYVFGKWPQANPETWGRYVDAMFGQVRELLTNYGEISVIWFDGGWERSADQWRAADLVKMIRELQPGIVINDRLPSQGDYRTPEQFVPAKPPDGPWETCMTMNESWAYNPADTHWKSPRSLVHTLCEVASKGGNLLLNVGPNGEGELAPEMSERLDVIAKWMERNAESMIGTTPGLEPWQFYGTSTRRERASGVRVYLHALMRPYDTVTVRGIRPQRVRAVTVLSTGEKLTHYPRVGAVETMINAKDPRGELIIEVPPSVIDDYATTFALDFDGEPA